MQFPKRNRDILKDPSHYKIIGEEGRGAYSVVQHVIDPDTRKSYALKKVSKKQQKIRRSYPYPKKGH